MLKKTSRLIGITFIAALLCSVQAFAAQTTAPTSITPTNNLTGIPDTITVSGLAENDIAKAYGSSVAADPIGVAIADSSGNATIYITQLGTSTGSVYVTATSKDSSESSRVAKAFSAEAISSAPLAGSISVSNYITGQLDTIAVTSLTSGDIVRAYSSLAGTVPISSSVVGALDTSATLYVNQLGTNNGTVYVSIQNSGSLESPRTAKSYFKESTTTAPATLKITVTNDIGTQLDTVDVSGLTPSEIVNVYSTPTSTATIGTAKADVDGNVSITLTGGTLSPSGGRIYISVTDTGSNESARAEVKYGKEATSAAPLASKITVLNKVSGSDSFAISGLLSGDTVKIYSSATSTLAIYTGTAAIDGTLSDTLSTGVLLSSGGNIYVTVTTTGKDESARTTVSYSSEKSTALAANAVTVTNNYTGTDDTVVISDVETGDIINIYKASTGTATWVDPVTLSDLVITNGATTIPIKQLGTTAGKLYVTITKSGKSESARIGISYSAEPITAALAASNVKVTNNIDSPDSVTISGLTIGQAVTVYSSLAGSTTLAADPKTTSTSETLTIAAGLLSKTKGKIYVTVQDSDKLESTRTAVSYAEESTSTAPLSTSITVLNNINSDDKVNVSGLKADDTVNVYASSTSTTPINSDKAASDGTASVSIVAGTLSSSGGRIYVSVTSSGANESSRTAITYAKEASSSALAVSDVSVCNYYNISDTITVSALTSGEEVKIYSSSTGTATIASGTATAASITFTLNSGVLVSTGGKIYVSVTSSSANESARTAVSYSSEKSTSLAVGAVTVANNYTGTDDTVAISGLATDDIINIYKTSTGTATWVDPITVTSNGTLTINITQLGTMAGKLYVSITKSLKSESARTVISYSPEPTATVPIAKAISVTNNYDAEDYVTVSGLSSGQTVNIYSSATITTTIASNTAADNNPITFTLYDGVLKAAGGKIYVSVKSDGSLESARVAVSYASEISTAPTKSNILVVNNSGSNSDTVTVTGLTSGDKVTVYDSLTGLTVLGTETAPSLEKSVSFTLSPNLSNAAGTVYVTVTSVNKGESKRTAVSYAAA